MKKVSFNDLIVCLLGRRAVCLDARTAGRANDSQTVELEVVADEVCDLVGKFPNGRTAVLLHHPAHGRF